MSDLRYHIVAKLQPVFLLLKALMNAFPANTASQKSVSIQSIVKYYASTMLIWMVSYFILGLLQLDRPGFSSDFISINISYAIWSGGFLGIIWGSIFKISLLFRNKLTSYFGTLLISVLANVLCTMLMVFCNYHIDEFVNLEDMPQTMAQLHQFYQSHLFYVLVIHTCLTALLYQFVYEMDRKLGRGVLRKFLLGRYYRPIEEQRVFLFMDLKSSTWYAEQLGHFKYSRLIQDCFNDLTSSVLKNKAQIYQYVGDEVVITWEMNRNFKATHCVNCFTDFTNSLYAKKEYYLTEYGMLPVFKAGLHAGKVMVAQVGQLKSELAFHGDAINTASRVQGLCNHYESSLLFTHNFLSLMNLGESGTIKFASLGPVEIKGKNNPVDLYRFVEG